MITIKRLYIENYKLFSQKEIDFSGALLSVFDGPNGYGKTSIFDAIELLITGKISRVKECESIDGKTGYQTVFFAQNSEKDVILKAEFEDEDTDRYFVLGAKVKAANVKGKFANPKNIFESIDFYYMPSYNNSINTWDNYIKSKEEIDQIRKNEFGHQNIEQFTLFHYIRQEDRLAYFKQNETSRSSTIEDLLGVEEERKKQKSIHEKSRAVEKLYKQLDGEIKSKKARLIEVNSKTEKNTEYAPLLDGKQVWDMETISFGESNPEKLLLQYNSELEKIEKYVQYADTHTMYFAFRKFMNIPENIRNSAMKALILLQKNPMSVDDIESAYQNQKFIQQQKEEINLQEYLKVDVQKICNILDIEADKELIDEIAVLRDISQNQSELQKALNNVLQIRQNLHREHAKIHDTAVCPYCGYNWTSEEQLEKHFDSTKDILQGLLTQDGEQFVNQLAVIKEKIEISIYKLLLEKEKELLQIEILDVYQKFESKDRFITITEKARPLFEITSHILVPDDQNLEDVQKQSDILLEECQRIGNSFSTEYLTANDKYNFEDIKHRYGMNTDFVSQIRLENIEFKRQYIQEQFYKSFDKLREEIADLEKKYKTLGTIRTQLKEYASAFDTSIELYKKQIIDEIEIPFFVYTSRLLQSYQGGQGVLMENNGESIRFTAPGNEHDILYTMSSGQLSAVLLSFSLALNKIYSGDGIKTVLIDDPIQCMDDINMISFVELLRREFSDCQIILSTHEEDFSNFIRYKFKKYDLAAQAITLKDA